MVANSFFAIWPPALVHLLFCKSIYALLYVNAWWLAAFLAFVLADNPFCIMIVRISHASKSGCDTLVASVLHILGLLSIFCGKLYLRFSSWVYPVYTAGIKDC